MGRAPTPFGRPPVRGPARPGTRDPSGTQVQFIGAAQRPFREAELTSGLARVLTDPGGALDQAPGAGPGPAAHRPHGSRAGHPSGGIASHQWAIASRRWPRAALAVPPAVGPSRRT